MSQFTVRAAVQAQKLADAPSAVMLAKNIEQQNAEAFSCGSARCGHAGRIRSDRHGHDTCSATNRTRAPVASIPAQLTLQEAEQIAIRNNPRVRVSQLLARAQHQVYRQTRSAYLPQLRRAPWLPRQIPAAVSPMMDCAPLVC